MCIDICPVGALTSGAYRYKTRPWEMNHVGTICTHCGDGCRTTLGVRRATAGMEIVRGDNRDKSGINGDFLCIKGRYAFDFADSPQRIKQPLLRQGGKLVPVSWEQAFDHIANRFKTVRDTQGGQAIGVIGSNRTTNEESYLLQKFARTVLGTNNIDHHRTADFPAFAAALRDTTSKTASVKDALTAKAVLVIGNNPTDQHPLLAWNIRTNVRINGGRLYVVSSQEIKLKRQSKVFANVEYESEFLDFLMGRREAMESNWLQLREALANESELLIAFGSALRGQQIHDLVQWGLQHPNARFLCLADYANSRGAADMGLYPDLLPGYMPVGQPEFSEEYG
jgi:NADH-quinone oxidoreductase subunit G